jgi:peptidoglycan-N-acetylglucosamine deacetylase
MMNLGYWPEPFQAAATITVNLDGESVEQRAMPGQPLWGRMSYGRYGVQAGVHRILDTLARYGVKATFFIPAFDAERDPALMEQIVSAGHEVAGRGYAYEDFSELSLADQEAALEQSENLFQSVFGSKPLGWRAPDLMMTSDTRKLLLKRGYLYDSSYCDDDVPYLVSGDNGATMVELPHFPQASDRPYYTVRRSPETVRWAWEQELAAVYQDGGLFNLAVHPRGDYGSGRGVRIPAFEQTIQQILDLPRLWLGTCQEIAEWKKAQG